MKRRNKSYRGLVTERLENISKDVFSKHFSLIKEIIGDSPGVYALYDSNGLYYVGKSTDLKNRVKHHLKDRHYALWSHFSLYLVRREAHIGDIESLLIRISNPTGNRVKPRGKSKSLLLKKLKKMVKEKQAQEFNDMFGGEKAKIRTMKKAKTKHPDSLKGMVTKRTALLAEYRGKEHKATLTSQGLITYKGKKYTSPSGAGRAVVVKKSKRTAVNGWHFWYIKDSHGQWVRLSEYKE